MKMDVDSHKLMYHPKRVSDWKEGKTIYPVYVEIGPTNSCNLRCKYCALDFTGYKNVFLKRETMISILKEFGQKGVNSIMFAGEGEPLLHKDMSEFVKIAKDSNLDIAITTNGIPLIAERAKEILPYLSWIRFSISAGTEISYANIQGTAPNFFKTVIKNLGEAVELKKSKNLGVTIGVQFLLLNQNVSELVSFARLCKNIGVDNLQVKPYSRHPDSKNDFTVDYEEFKLLEQPLIELNSDSFKVLFRSQTMERLRELPEYLSCFGLDFFALIDAQGNVIPCNMFYGKPDFYYGNLYQNSFSEIWEGKCRQDVKKKINDLGISNCRKGCRLDSINRYLDRLTHPFSHDNFP